MKRAFAAIVLAWLPAGALAQQPDFSTVEIKVEHAGGNVHMLTGAGGNIGVSIGPDGVLVVDDQFAPLVPKIRAAIKGLTDKPVRFVLNTHWHFDHTGGNQDFARDATLIAHDNVRRRLAEGASIAGRSIPPAPAEALPIITFDDSLTVHWNGEAIRALHYAKGHTDGDSVIWFPKSNVVHMGDHFVTYGLPFVDVASGGSLLGMIDNVERAMEAVPDDVKVIPGHGPLSGKTDVAKFTAMLRDCVRLVETAMNEGQTLEQMQAENVLAPYDELGRGFVKTADFIALIHNELSGRAGNTSLSSRRHH
jgi:glyoxylase-like metal-dependent hydrolase (beta-lactamase superfamily II)